MPFQLPSFAVCVIFDAVLNDCGEIARMHTHVWPERVMAQRRSWRALFVAAASTALHGYLIIQKSDFRQLGT